MKTLIKNAVVVLPEGLVETSVLIDGTKIAAIDAAIQTVVDQTVDACGKHLIPGVIDDQVPVSYTHLTLPTKRIV